MKRQFKKMVAFTLAIVMTLMQLPAISVKADSSFSLSMESVDMGSLYETSGKYYFQTNTKGANWKVHQDTNSEQLVIDGTSSQRARIALDDAGNPSYLVMQKVGRNLVLSFTAPQEGYYDLSAIAYWNAKGGQGEITVNGSVVGTFDCYQGSDFNTQQLGQVYLNAGEMANTMIIRATGITSGTGKYIYFKGFNFTKVESAPEPTAAPTLEPTQAPTMAPTLEPTLSPTLEPTMAPSANQVPFSLSMQTVDMTCLYETSGKYYFQANTVGANWKVHPDTNAEQLVIDGTSSQRARIALDDDSNPSYLVMQKVGRNLVLSFTAPAEGYYDLSAIAYWNAKGGQGEVSINGTSIGTFDCYQGSDFNTQQIGRVYLNAGEMANTITIRATGNTSGSGKYLYFRGFEFDLPSSTPVEPTPAPTVAPTVAPSLAPTVAPTNDPNATREDFRVTFEKTELSSLYTADGSRYYFVADTYGENWKVHSSTSADNLVTNGTTSSRARQHFDDYGMLSHVVIQKTNRDFVLSFTAPAAGYYDLTSIVSYHNNGGYGDIYINDVYVGTIDSHIEPDMNEQKLLGVFLNGGEMANKVRVRATGKSTGSGTNSYFRSFDFTVSDNIASITGLNASADTSAMYVGRTEQIDTEAITSNGSLYFVKKGISDITYTSSDESVATVSNDGLITAIGAGDATITVKSNQFNLSDTISFSVSGAPYDKVVMNLEDGENLYVQTEKELSVVATLQDGTQIADKDLTVAYSSSDNNIAKVENGILKVVGTGTATITAEATFKVNNVKKTDSKQIVATSMPLQSIQAKTEKSVVQELDKDGVKLVINGIAQDGSVIEDFMSAGYQQLDITFTSLNPELLSVDSNGICKYVSRGVAKVQIDALVDGVPYQCIVDVVSSSGKTGRTFFTEEMVQNARYNAVNYKWGISNLKAATGIAWEIVTLQDYVYNSIPAEGVPRSNNISTYDAPRNIAVICPNCGIDVDAAYNDVWGMDFLRDPWKIWCLNCKARFPSNDFALLYERGLDENGEYNRELAYQRNAEAVARGEKDALVNELYPEKGSTWMVDDGFGWSPVTGTYGTNDMDKYAPIAHYAHSYWFKGSNKTMNDILGALRDAYLWTGDERYGRTGAILLDRIADLYPSYDITKVSLGYNLSHGGGFAGKIVGAIWECSLAKTFTECYDAFYPMYDDPEVIAYLSNKSVELDLDNPKTNGNLIRENIENGILRSAIKGLHECDIYGNFGFPQSVAVRTAVILDTQPETNDLFEWLKYPCVLTKEGVTDPIYGTKRNSRCNNSGGEMALKYINGIDRDGFGGEVSTTYNEVWMVNGVEIADILARYGSDVLNLYENPKFIRMFDSFVHMSAGDGYTLALGDGGEASEPDLISYAIETLRGYSVLRDPKLAQIYDYYVRGDYSNTYIDMYSNPADLVTSINAVIEQYGPLKLESENLTGYGLSFLRGGDNEGGFETRYDTWMYYGRTSPSHAHYDVLQLGLDAYGFDYTPDMGYPEDTGNSANRYEWIKASISHNLVLVNEESQKSVYTGTPLHFDSTDNVKVMDNEAPGVYDAADIYRRTAVTIAFNDDVSYTLDFFRVKGGNKHTYSFHTQSYKNFVTDDLTLVPQVNEKGEYIGTYAGPDVPYGPDPNSTDAQYAPNPVYPRGYTWLTDVNRGTDKSGDGLFTINFKQTDFKHQVLYSNDLQLNVHAVNDWTPDSVDIMVGHPTRKLKNEEVLGYDYMLIQRTGENLDTLFTTVFEPFRTDNYIHKAEPLVPTIKDGTEGADDIVKVVKVTMRNGRVDYVVYATNNQVTYTVTDGNVSFDFAGFIGVYTVDFYGNYVYSYVNDGTIIGNVTAESSYSGKVIDFTKEFVKDNYILVQMDQNNVDLSTLKGRYIYIDNTGAQCTGAYRIEDATQEGEYVSLYLGNCSLMERYVDDYNPEAGYLYTIAEGRNFNIPLSADDGSAFTGTARPAGSYGGGSSSSNTGTTDTTEETVATDTASVETSAEVNGEVSNDVVDDTKSETNEEAKDDKSETQTSETKETEDSKETESGDTPDASKDAAIKPGNIKNYLLGGLGVLALLAGLFLILLGKRKEKEE